MRKTLQAFDYAKLKNNYAFPHLLWECTKFTLNEVYSVHYCFKYVIFYSRKIKNPNRNEQLIISQHILETVNHKFDFIL